MSELEHNDKDSETKENAERNENENASAQANEPQKQGEKPDLPIDHIQSYVRSFSENGGPEPPKKPFSSNKTNRVSIGNISFDATAKEAEQFKSARAMLYASIIMGIISLFIGGVILSAIGLVFGVMAYMRMKEVSECKSIDDPFVARAFKRSGIAGILICAITLILNFYSMAVMWPQIMEYLNNTDYSTALSDSNLFGFSGTSTGGSTSTWG